MDKKECTNVFDRNKWTLIYIAVAVTASLLIQLAHFVGWLVR